MSEKGVKWRVRVLFNNGGPQHTEHSTSKAIAPRIAKNWLHSTNVKAVEVAEVRKVERITPAYWFDAPGDQ